MLLKRDEALGVVRMWKFGILIEIVVEEVFSLLYLCVYFYIIELSVLVVFLKFENGFFIYLELYIGLNKFLFRKVIW